MKTIFSSLNERALSFSLAITESGFILEGTTFPHISIQQISATPFQDNSLVSRQEHHSYQFSLYSNSFDELDDYLNTIRTNFSFCILDIDYRKFSACQYSNEMRREEEAGIWHGIIVFDIYVEKDLIQPKWNSGLDLLPGIQEINSVALEENLLVGTQLENNQTPYATINYLNSQNDSGHSFGNLNNNNFSFELYDQSLTNLEQRLEKYHDTYDYAQINKLLTLQWLMDTIVELEPGIWRAKSDYLTTKEELINV